MSNRGAKVFNRDVNLVESAKLTKTIGGVVTDIVAADGDISAVNLAVSGTTTLATGAKITTAASNTIVPVVVAFAQEVIAAGTGGAINITSHMTDISTDAGGDAFTLALSTTIGQVKYILLTVDGGGDAVITSTFAGGNNTLTMADAGDYAMLMWDGTSWAPYELGNRVDGVSKPALSTV